MQKSPKLALLAGVILTLLAVVVSVAPALGQTSADARARFVHAIPGATAIDIYTDNTLTVANLQLGDASLYIHLPAGQHQVTVTQADVTTTLWTQTINVDPGTAYTYVASTTDPLTFVQYKDDLAPLPLGKSRFTTIHAIPGGPALDVLLSDGRPVVSGLQYPQEYGTLDVPSLVYELAVVPSGETVDNALVPAQPYALASGTSYALLVYGSPARPQVKLLASAADSESAGGYLRLAHGAVGAEPVDVYVNNTLVAPSLAFGQATEFMATPPGSYNISVRQAGAQEDLTLGTVDLKEGDSVTAVALGGSGGITLNSYSDTVSTLNQSQAGINIINALPDDGNVSLELADGTTVVADVPAGQTGFGMAAPTAGDATVTIAGDTPVTASVAFGNVYGGVYYDVLVAQGDDGPTAVLLNPASVVLGPNSAPGNKSLAVETPVVTEAPTVAQVTVAETAAPPETATPAPVTEPPAQTGVELGPTARVLLDPGANLQLRQLPRSNALSLGLAPSGTVLIVNGREGAPEPPAGATPDPNATPWTDPVSQLTGADLEPATTWINVTYAAPDGTSITAWVNALYVGVSSADGLPLPLKNLATIPGNRAGQVNAGVAPTAVPPREDQVIATVGGLDSGVNLQVRRTPTQDGESLTRVPNGTQLEFLGVNSDRTWIWVRFATPEGSVTGWVNARYIISYTYQGGSIDLAGLEQKHLLTVIADDQRGTVGGTIEAPALPTIDPFKNAIVATVEVNEGTNLQLRRKANENAESLGLVPNATRLIVKGRTEDGNWLLVDYQSQTGWVSVKYVSLTFNGQPYELGQIPVYKTPLTDEQINGTMTATYAPFLTSWSENGPPSRNSKSRIRQNSASARRSDDSTRTPPGYENTSSGYVTMAMRSTFGRSLAYRSRSRNPAPPFHRECGPTNDPPKMTNVRSCRTSGGMGAKV